MKRVKKLQLSDVLKKHLRVVGFLLASGALGFTLAEYVMKNPVLAVLLAPAINYVLYVIVVELKKEGIVEYLRQK